LTSLPNLSCQITDQKSGVVKRILKKEITIPITSISVIVQTSDVS
jgi:hypothetical protein